MVPNSRLFGNYFWFCRLLIGVVCLLLGGCQPSYISDQGLKDRFARNRPDFESLVLLFQSQPANDITANTDPPHQPRPPVPSDNWIQIHDLLIKLNVRGIGRRQDEIVVEVQDTDTGLTNARHYYFEYRTNVEPHLVPSLYDVYDTGFYNFHSDFNDLPHMRLDDNWYATVYED